MMTEQTPFKSWWDSQYPFHACPDCGMEHKSIPHISAGVDKFIPVEITGTFDGIVDMPNKAKARILTLVWGIPGTNKGQPSFLYAN